MVAYYQHQIIPWMDGTESLDDGPYRAYHVVCELIYLNNGPIKLHESGIAGRCNQHTLAFRKNLKTLLELGKLVVLPDGKLSNKRADEELKKIASRRRHPTPNPAPTPPEPPRGSPEVQRGSAGGSADNPLKNKDQTLFGDRLEEKKREDTEGAKAPSATDDPRTRLFRSGLETLKRITGRTPDSCRSLIGRWLKSVDDESIHVLGAIEDAERNGIANPVPWIEQALASRGRPRRGGSRNGAAALEMRFMQNQEDHDATDASTEDDRRTVPTGERPGALGFHGRGGHRRS